MIIIRPIIRPLLQASSTPFTPQDMFASGELGAWFTVRPEYLFSDIAGTLPVGLGTTAARLNGFPLNATQDNSSQRPVYGRRPPRGIVNKLLHTENPTNAYWTRTVGTVTEGIADPFGKNNAFTLQATANNQVWRRAFTGLSGSHYLSFWIRRRAGSGSILFYSLSALSGGSINSDFTNWTRHSFLRETPTGTGDNFGIRIDTSGDAIDIYAPQVEATSLTEPQFVGANTYDVYERTGVTRYFLEDDGIDDALNVTMPNLGSNATIAWASDTGVTIQTGQTVGAGAYDILRNSQLSEFVAINRALTAGETSSLTSYFNGRLGI